LDATYHISKLSRQQKSGQQAALQKEARGWDLLGKAMLDAISQCETDEENSRSMEEG
jgi:hypothetical protein